LSLHILFSNQSASTNTCAHKCENLKIKVIKNMIKNLKKD